METNKEMLDEFRRGFAFCIAVVGGLLMVTLIIQPEKDKPEEKFKVVDKYGPCEVVRYTDETNRWHYFLDCK